MNASLRACFILGLALMITAAPGLAQDEAVEEESESEPIPMAEMGMGGGGALGGWMFLDVAELNADLDAAGYAPFPDGLLLKGGGGGGGLLKGFRFGGYGASGEVYSALGGKRAMLSVGFGGVWLSYGLVSEASYDLAAGLMIGGGGATLKLTGHQPESFQDAIGRPANTVLERGFFALRPDINLGIQMLSWLSLNVSGGYLVTLGDEWTHDGMALPGPPASFNGWTVHVMLQFGGRD